MRKITTIIALVLLTNAGFTQEKAESRGLKEFENYDYYAAIDNLETVQQKNTDVLRKLAEGYNHIADYAKAEVYYSQLVARTDRIPADHLNYARILMKNQKYQLAEDQIKQFAKLNPGNEEMARWELLTESLAEYSQKGAAVKVSNLDINSEHEDFSPVVLNSKMYFASSRTEKITVKRHWSGNRLPFLDIYTADVSGSQLNGLSPINSKEINKKYNEGPIAFSPNGNEAYITVNNYNAVSASGVRLLSLYIVRKTGDTWSTPEPLAFNSMDYSVGHACVAPDGMTIYFASDMPGGKGGVDIYRSRMVGGTWTSPENVEEVNSWGDDMFPYVHESGLFFYSSNGQPGYGGLDVFVGKMEGTQIKQLRNVGAPFNSSYDDFSVWLDPQGINGFFASNRTGGKGNDDLYSVQLDKPFSFGRSLEILVLDEKKNPLPNANIELKNASGEVILTGVSDANGKVKTTLDKEGAYSISGKKENYFPGDAAFSVKENDGDELTQQIVIEKDPGLQLYAKITDKKSGTPVDSVKITLVNNFTGVSETFSTSSAGEILTGIYDRKVGDRISYNIKLEKQGYITKEITYNKQLDKPGVYDASKDLNLSLEKMDIGMDLAKAIDLKPIYFDLGKFDIRPDAAVELDKIVKVMNDYPTMIVELGAHTDCRGSAPKNLELSDKRAVASADYIKARINNPARISGKGYGETKILNGCTCEGKKNPKYTEAQHAANRRTEFLVVKI